VPGSKKKSPCRNYDTEMHRPMHHTDAVPKLAGRQIMSLVARYKKLNGPLVVYESNLYVTEKSSSQPV